MKIRALLLFLVLSATVNASPLKQIHVYAEEDDEQSKKCNIDSNIVVAAVESVFRQNRIEIRNSNQSDLLAYVNITALNISSGCAISNDFNIYMFSFTKLPGSNRSMPTRNTFCKKGSTLTGNPANIQSRVNEQYRSFVELCISEIERKLR